MLPTIVFFLALLISIVSVLFYMNVNGGYILAKEETKMNAIGWVMIIITCFLWSWLFYLIH